MKQLAKEFEGQFECSEENTENYKIFSLQIKREIDNGRSIIWKIKFIDSFKFTSSKLSSLVDNLSNGFHKRM